MCRYTLGVSDDKRYFGLDTLDDSVGGKLGRDKDRYDFRLDLGLSFSQ